MVAEVIRTLVRVEKMVLVASYTHSGMDLIWGKAVGDWEGKRSLTF